MEAGLEPVSMADWVNISVDTTGLVKAALEMDRPSDASL